jgi:hypothetical protein
MDSEGRCTSVQTFDSSNQRPLQKGAQQVREFEQA